MNKKTTIGTIKGMLFIFCFISICIFLWYDMVLDLLKTYIVPCCYNWSYISVFISDIHVCTHHGETGNLIYLPYHNDV